MHVTKFGPDVISRTSNVQNIMFNERSPSWIQGLVAVDRFEDESQLINIGWPQEYDITTLIFNGGLQQSSWVNYPYKYKFTSLDMYIRDTVMVTSRETYGLLDIFGDIGGVFTFFTLPLGFLLSSRAVCFGTDI